MIEATKQEPEVTGKKPSIKDINKSKLLAIESQPEFPEILKNLKKLYRVLVYREHPLMMTDDPTPTSHHEDEQEDKETESSVFDKYLEV